MGLFKKKKDDTTDIIDDGSKVYNLKSNCKYEIVIKNNFISITSTGALNTINRGLVGTKKIDMNNITAVQYKQPGLTTGYLQFILVGSQETKSGVMGAVKDDNTILFSKKENDIILEIKEHIENYIVNKSNNQNINNKVSVADELLKFKELLDMGVINEEEFENKKKQLLNN